jgi:hypothetical protein
MAETKIHVGEGQICPRCSHTMQTFRKPDDFKPRWGQVYAIKWDYCFNCKKFVYPEGTMQREGGWSIVERRLSKPGRRLPKEVLAIINGQRG